MGKKAYDVRLEVTVSLRVIAMADSPGGATAAAVAEVKKYLPGRNNPTGDGILLSEFTPGEPLSSKVRRITKCNITKNSKSTSINKSKVR